MNTDAVHRGQLLRHAHHPFPGLRLRQPGRFGKGMVGLIEDGEPWMLMIQDRNLTSHTFNRATADAIAEQIIHNHLPCFRQLRARLEQRLAEELAQDGG